MRTLFLVSILLAACTTFDDAEPTDAGVDGIAVVLPCNVQHAACDAARDLAEVVCQRKIDCDPLYTRTLLECVAGEMSGYCATVTCNGPYDDRSALDACIGELRGAACDSSLTCSL